MSRTAFTYSALALAIACEVAATACLMKTEQFTRLVPSVLTGCLYALSFFFLSHALKGIPLGIAYAVWSSLGIVLTATVGLVVFGQTLDAPAVIGIALMVAGVVVMQVFSDATVH